jgi:hypothetical protein
MKNSLLLFFSSIVSLHANNYLSIATANINYKNIGNKQAIEDILKNDADIIVIIEWTGDSLFRKEISEHHYKFDLDNSLYNGTHGIGIISKYGIEVKARIIKSPIIGPCRIPFGIAEVKKGKSVFSLLCCHVPPPVKSCNETTDPTLREITSWVKNGNIVKDISNTNTEMPLLIAGDMNAPPNNPEIKKLKEKGLKDALENKFGFNYTWGPVIGMPKILQIDYLFIPYCFTIINSKIFPISGSDHKGIKAEIQLE